MKQYKMATNIPCKQRGMNILSDIQNFQPASIKEFKYLQYNVQKT